MRVGYMVAAAGLASILLSQGLAAQQRAATPPPRVITITVGDPVDGKAAYSVSRIMAKPGERLTIRLMSTAQTPKVMMAHNLVLLKKGTNAKAFTDAAANAKATDYIPPALKGQIIADIPFVGPGERADVTVTVPKVPGTYPYVCTFPGHYVGGMFGDLIVK